MSSEQEADGSRARHTETDRLFFEQELGSCIGNLISSGVKIPEGLQEEINGIIDPFSKAVFRRAASHLLRGLHPTLLEHKGGEDLIQERLAALPYNLRDAINISDDLAEEGPPAGYWDQLGMEGA